MKDLTLEYIHACGFQLASFFGWLNRRSYRLSSWAWKRMTREHQDKLNAIHAKRQKSRKKPGD
jgi:hypothetical protein